MTRWRNTFLAVAVALAFTIPTYWMLVSALRPEADILRYFSPFSIEALVPINLTFENVTDLIGGGFGRSTLNSLIVAVATTAVGLLISLPAAFALAVLHFPARSFVFAVLVVAFSIPFDVVAVPLAGQFRELGLDNTYAGLILPGIGNGFAIYLLQQFFLAVPPSLAEAARLDGASWWTILWRIYVPLAKAPMVGAALIIFIYQWQAFLWPLLAATEPSMQLAPITLSTLSNLYEVHLGQIFAGALILAVIPGLVLFASQRYFVQSIATTGQTG